MREILFKAVSVNLQSFVESLTFAHGTIKRKRGWMFFEINEKWVGVIPKTVGQYIGMTDKSGVKIFAGDIVRANGTLIEKKHDYSAARKLVNQKINDEYELIEEKALFTCEWYNPFSSFRFSSTTHSICADISMRDLEVVGNIHEIKNI